MQFDTEYIFLRQNIDINTVITITDIKKLYYNYNC